METPRIAFVQSCWHKELVDQARAGFVDFVANDASVEFFEVPGAFELPLQAQILAATGRFDAIVAAGFVIDGGIYRHEFVADAVIGGLMRVQLDQGIPLFSCVLTPQRFHETADHLEFFRTHMLGKGREAAETCLRTLDAHARSRQA